MFNVLIALDGSQAAHSILQAVSAHPWPGSVAFKVLTVLETNADCNDVSATFHADTELVDEAVLQLELRYPESLVIGHIERGVPAYKILSLAETWPADWLVMGSPSSESIKDARRSVAVRLMERTGANILIGRSGNEPTGGPHPFESIFLVIDGATDSRCANKAVDVILKQPWSSSVHFHVCGLMSQHSDFQFALINAGSVQRISSSKVLISRLKDIRNRLAGKFSSNQISTSIIEEYNIANFLQELQKQGADLIVLGTRGRSSLPGTAEYEIATQSPCSVEIIQGAPGLLRAPLPIFSETNRPAQDRVVGF